MYYVQVIIISGISIFDDFLNRDKSSLRTCIFNYYSELIIFSFRFHRDLFGVVREVTDGGRYTITRQGQNRVLTIQRPQADDEGDYFITAENCVGSVSTQSVPTTIELYVPPDIQPEIPVVPPEGSCQNNQNYLTINVQGNDIVVSNALPFQYLYVMYSNCDFER